MKWFVMLCCMIVVKGFALTPPQPIQGSANIRSKQLTVGFGNAEIVFAFPEGWGMGQMTSSAIEGKGHFELYPTTGGVGCSIDVVRYENEEAIQKEIARLQQTFKFGFESELSNAYYACRVNQLHLIQIWYAFNKKKLPTAAKWEVLRNCISLNFPYSFDKEEYTPLKEITNQGWVCNHPDNQLHVLFKNGPLVKCTPNDDSSLNYQFRFDSIKAFGYFYVSWNQAGLDTEVPYREQLQLMMNDLQVLAKNQKKFSDGPKYDLNQGYAIWEGYPYSLLVVSANNDPFIFGFVVKLKINFSYDLNDLIHEVVWWYDK